MLNKFLSKWLDTFKVENPTLFVVIASILIAIYGGIEYATSQNTAPSWLAASLPYLKWVFGIVGISLNSSTAPFRGKASVILLLFLIGGFGAPSLNAQTWYVNKGMFPTGSSFVVVNKAQTPYYLEILDANKKGVGIAVLAAAQKNDINAIAESLRDNFDDITNAGISYDGPGSNYVKSGWQYNGVNIVFWYYAYDESFSWLRYSDFSSGRQTSFKSSDCIIQGNILRPSLPVFSQRILAYQKIIDTVKSQRATIKKLDNTVSATTTQLSSSYNDVIAAKRQLIDTMTICVSCSPKHRYSF